MWRDAGWSAQQGQRSKNNKFEGQRRLFLFNTVKFIPIGTTDQNAVLLCQFHCSSHPPASPRLHFTVYSLCAIMLLLSIDVVGIPVVRYSTAQMPLGLEEPASRRCAMPDLTLEAINGIRYATNPPVATVNSVESGSAVCVRRARIVTGDAFSNVSLTQSRDTL